MYQKVLFLLIGIALGAVGCSADRVKRSNDLKEIGLNYHKYYDATQKAPEKAEDLITPDMNKDAAARLKSGDIVFIYGVSLGEILKAGKGTSETVIAYEKVTPDKGGHVLFADASVKYLSADEFKKATLAKKK